MATFQGKSWPHSKAGMLLTSLNQPLLPAIPPTRMAMAETTRSGLPDPFTLDSIADIHAFAGYEAVQLV